MHTIWIPFFSTYCTSLDDALTDGLASAFSVLKVNIKLVPIPGVDCTSIKQLH